MHQRVAAEDALEMVHYWMLRENVECIIEGKQAPQSTSGCFVTDAASSNAVGGRAGEGAAKAQCLASGAPGDIANFAR